MVPGSFFSQNPGLTPRQTLCTQSPEATVLLALRIFHSSSPVPATTHADLQRLSSHSHLSDPFRTKDHGPAPLTTVQEPPIPLRAKPASPDVCEAARDLALRPWPSPCPPLSCPLGRSSARGYSDLCGFAAAVPSRLEALPPDAPLGSLSHFTRLCSHITWRD